MSCFMQGWTWSEQYQQYGMFGYDESGLYCWYPAPPVRGRSSLAGPNVCHHWAMRHQNYLRDL